MNWRPLALLCAALAIACTPPPGTASRILQPRFTEGQEIRAGQRAAREASRALGLVADQALQDYVQQLGARLASASERSQLPWTFRVVDDPMPNAFAMPGGYVFVTRGMLAILNSEAELAALLAHEVGHVNARHGVRQIQRQVGPQLGVWAVPVADVRGLDLGSATGAGFLYLSYGTDAEREADRLAARYVLAAGYDVRAMADLSAAANRAETIGGRSALPPWPTTHPDPGDRAVAAAERAAALPDPPDGLPSNRTEYLDEIEDLAYGQDPRQGFFRGATFVHPELRLRVELPSGWRYRSLAQALVATNPEQDAALQLTIVEQLGPAEAAERFLRQAGVAPTDELTVNTVNGNPLVSAPFRVTTGAGSGTGTAAWIGYGGRTFQLVGVAAGEAANGHTLAFRQTIGSFAPVTDPRLLEVRPTRINIVRLGRATTFQEFNRRYPSAIGAEELAVLNRVAGGSTRLRAGARVKRVVKG